MSPGQRLSFLPGLRQLCDEQGPLLIFDETITGFRYHLGGAQTLFGVTPDLAAFGKGMANGFPISAVVGKRDYMRRMEDIFFSGTFGGDAIALAAAHAVIKKMQRLDGRPVSRTRPTAARWAHSPVAGAQRPELA